MENLHFIAIFFALIYVPWSCLLASASVLDTKIFLTSLELFPNPERGWILHRFSNDMWGLDKFRNGEGNISLVLIKVDISSYRTSTHIAQSKLNEIRTALNSCRTHGLKAILRSAYAWDEILAPEPAQIQTIEAHIGDMGSIYHEFEDTIVAVEMGMFGPWGEMHSSKYSTINTQLYYPIKTDALRLAHKAYMSVLPKTCFVLVRRPYYIREIFNTEEPIVFDEAYGKTEKGRTGYHNDGYLSDATDLGTFGHNWSRDRELTYINAMTRYAIFGGETVWSSYNAYSTGNNALNESRRLHMTYLHRDYDTRMYNTWGSSIKNEFTRKLGYQFELVSFSYSKQVAPGAVLHFILKLKNNGFAPMYRSRPVILILDNRKANKDNVKYQTKLSVDPRTWTPETGIVTIERRISIPISVTSGIWQLLLALPDTSPRLFTDPRYAVRFASEDVWDNNNGANVLTKEFNVTTTAPSESIQHTAFQEIATVPTPSISQLNAVKAAQILTLTAKYDKIYPYHQVFIDADNDATTGFLIKGIGADLLVENNDYYFYKGSTGHTWDWQSYDGTSLLSINDHTYSWRLPTDSLRKPILSSSRVIFGASDGQLADYSAIISTTVA